jgi:hypothetical protein
VTLGLLSCDPCPLVYLGLRCLGFSIGYLSLPLAAVFGLVKCMGKALHPRGFLPLSCSSSGFSDVQLCSVFSVVPLLCDPCSVLAMPLPCPVSCRHTRVPGSEESCICSQPGPVPVFFPSLSLIPCVPQLEGCHQPEHSQHQLSLQACLRIGVSALVLLQALLLNSARCLTLELGIES